MAGCANEARLLLERLLQGISTQPILTIWFSSPSEKAPASLQAWICTSHSSNWAIRPKIPDQPTSDRFMQKEYHKHPKGACPKLMLIYLQEIPEPIPIRQLQSHAQTRQVLYPPMRNGLAGVFRNQRPTFDWPCVKLEKHLSSPQRPPPKRSHTISSSPLF